ncbi:MAG TPA: TVP38/TMEM64 family protein [Thermodesulfobacteriota bacterium]
MGPAARRALYALVPAAVAAGAVLAVPPLREAAGIVGGLLLAGDTQGLRAYLLDFGPWAAAVSALLMVAQAIIAPLPAFVITLANGLVFGPVLGGLLSWSSALVGAWVCFGISRSLGRPAAERLVGRAALGTADAFFRRYGVQAIVVARLVPFVPFDPISYAAGLTAMSQGRFLLGTGLGQLPATALYSWFGGRAADTVDILFGVLAVTAAAWLLGRALRRRPAHRAKGRQAGPGA